MSLILNFFTIITKNLLLKNYNPSMKLLVKLEDKLDKEKSLIAFVGAPWTLLIYMLDSKLNKNELDYKKIKLREEEISLILDELNEYLSIHIENQINAGADVVQIFDSWAGLIKPEDFINYCIEPNLKLVNFCKKKNIPVICFPRGIGEIIKEFNDIVRPDGLNIDYEVEPVG